VVRARAGGGGAGQASRGDAAAALLRLRRLVPHLAFADAERVRDTGAPVPVVDTAGRPGKDESAFLVALLTAVCRPCLWLAPGLLVRAPEYSGAGTGKGLLVRALCAVAFVPGRWRSRGRHAEEFDKRIAAALWRPARRCSSTTSTPPR
jgi:hypothetical protein